MTASGRRKCMVACPTSTICVAATGGPRRRTSAPTVASLSRSSSADLMRAPLRVRRRELEQMLSIGHPCIQLVAHTADATHATNWLTVPSTLGVVAKRIDRPYIPGRPRDWIKVKLHRTVDCVVMRVAGDVETPQLVLGLAAPPPTLMERADVRVGAPRLEAWSSPRSGTSPPASVPPCPRPSDRPADQSLPLAQRQAG